MNAQQTKQVLSGIADCEKIINKESNRSADLRPESVQQILDHAISHKSKLVKMLSENTEITSVWIS